MTRSIGIMLSLALGILSTANANAAQHESTVQIAAITSQTSKHGSPVAQNTTVITVSGAALANNCQYLWIPTANGSSVDANSATMSVLMAALLSGKSVTFQYYDHVTAPWGATNVCAVAFAKISA